MKTKEMRAFTHKIILSVCFIALSSLSACAQKEKKVAALATMPLVITVKSNWNKLSGAENNVIARKGTEAPGSGALLHNKEQGTYICKRCNKPLYNSSAKFESNTGWPSFDDEIKGAVKHVKDADGQREELLCNNCGAHLGHVFYGEGFTKKNLRNCVNSLSLNFVAKK